MIRYETRPDGIHKITEEPLNLKDAKEMSAYVAWRAQEDLKPKRRNKNGKEKTAEVQKGLPNLPSS